MIYTDFEDNRPEMWTWVDDNGGFKFINYHAENFIYSDTDSGYFSVPDTYSLHHNEDDIIACADAIGEEVNRRFPSFIKFALNIPEERSHLIGTARETVADSGIWLSKKRYILRIIDDEGKRVNKLKMQGVQLKRSDTSAFTKTLLRHMVDAILDHADLNELQDIIDKYKKEFRKAPLSEIATPMGSGNIHGAMEKYELYGKFKGVHYAAKASALYNMKCSSTDKPIFPGEKIRILKIKGDKLSTSIAFPADINKLPDWFMGLDFDYDGMWVKVDKVVNDYLKTIGFDLSSRKKQLRNELFGF